VGEEPKLIDFGLAKLATATSSAGLTRTGQIVGTPEYMSPEQIANKEIDGRSDVYSLGCLLYEMLTGRPPFSGSDDVQLLYQQLQRPAEPLSRHLPDAPPGLEAVLERALAKDPDQRFASMREMAEALTGVEQGSRVLMPRRLLQKKRPRFTLVAAVAVLGLLGGFGLGRMSRRMGGANRGALIIASRPPGANVVVDGRSLEETTPTVAQGLGAGRHTVHLQHGKLAAVERQVELQPGERQVVDVALPPSSRRVEVRSVPEGATVFLDGRLAVGVTPTTVDITEDDFHELRLEKTGFEAGTRALGPDDHDAVVSLALQPERQPRATLYVDANTAGAVFIDGIDTGYVTPTIGIHLQPGPHLIEVRDGAARASRQVTLVQGHTERLLLQPAPAPPAP
jgi:hypothetical protein